MKRVLVACAAAVLISVAGCGSGTGSAPIDPATLAPPGALAFASFDMAPEGPEKADFEAAFGKLLGPAPEAKLGAAFTKAVRTSSSLDYLGDVKPWLGDTVSVVVTRVAPHKCDFALLAASTDDDQARAAIKKDLAGVNTETLSYRDVSYERLNDGTVNAVVSHFLVAGTESAFKAVVDAVKDGKSLAGSDRWKATVGDRAEGKTGVAFVDVKGVLQSFASNMPGAQRFVAPLLLGLVDIHPFVATLDAQPDALVVDVSSPGTKPDPRGPAAASSPLIESMPAKAWLALAVPDVGPTLSKVATALKANPLIAAEYARIAERFRARTGLDLDKDLLTLGDVGLYARGKTGTIVAEARPATLQRLRASIEPRAYHHLRVRGPARAEEPLGSTSLYKQAVAAIGGRPTLFAHDVPHLRRVEFIAAGVRREADLDVARGVIGLR